MYTEPVGLRITPYRETILRRMPQFNRYTCESLVPGTAIDSELTWIFGIIGDHSREPAKLPR